MFTAYRLRTVNLFSTIAIACATLLASGCCDERFAAFSADDMCVAEPPEEPEETTGEGETGNANDTVVMGETSAPGTGGMSETSAGVDTEETDPTTGGPPEGDCCDIHGSRPGADGICEVSSKTQCVGCDWGPVLCMTHGCAVQEEQDCCLSATGFTVPCTPG